MIIQFSCGYPVPEVELGCGGGVEPRFGGVRIHVWEVSASSPDGDVQDQVELFIMIEQTIMIYEKQIAIQRVVSIYKGSWSGIQCLV